MDQATTLQIIFLIILLLLSAFFSSAETALTTVSKIRMRTMAEDGNKKAALVLKITDDASKMLSAILIGNNIVNLSASSITTSLAIRLFGSIAAGIATGILTLLILIFGEISPKTLATIHADKISMKYASAIYGLMYVLTPVIFIINALSMLFLKLLRVDPNHKQDTLTEDELRTIVDVSQENGIIEDEEREFINNIFDFTDTEAKEVMVPRIHMTFVDVSCDYEELYELFRETRYTRIPVFEGTNDNVIGIVNIKDLIFYEDKGHFSIRDIMREPYFTYEHKNTAELLAEMRGSSINIAIILDEYGATAGMVSLEDLLEEIVGEIHDEYDANEEDDITELSDHEYEVIGSANLDDICEELELPFSSEDSDSIGGYLLELLGHLPSTGESVTTEDGITLKVSQMDKNRIAKILIEKPAPLTEENPDA